MSFSFGLRLHFSLNASKSARDIELPFHVALRNQQVIPVQLPLSHCV